MNSYEALLEVQRLDTEIGRIDRKLAALPEAEQLAAAEMELSAIRSAESGAASRLRDEERVQQRLEQELAGLSEKAQRERAKLMGGSVTNPKELAGLEEEVRSLERRADEVETRLLEQMETVEAAASGRRQAAEALGVATEAEARAREAYNAERKRLMDERAGLEEQRACAAKDVGEALMSRYEKLRGQLRGVAVGKLEKDTCSACRVELPSSERDRIAGADELERCPECRRLLVTERLLQR